MCWLCIAILFLLTMVTYLIPLRYLILIWGESTHPPPLSTLTHLHRSEQTDKEAAKAKLHSTQRADRPPLLLAHQPRAPAVQGAGSQTTILHHHQQGAEPWTESQREAPPTIPLPATTATLTVQCESEEVQQSVSQAAQLTNVTRSFLIPFPNVCVHNKIKNLCSFYVRVASQLHTSLVNQERLVDLESP